LWMIGPNVDARRPQSLTDAVEKGLEIILEL
jgi:hypothetical protein